MTASFSILYLFLFYPQYKPFHFVTTACTVLLLIPIFFAVWRTVALYSIIYRAASTARSSIYPFTTFSLPCFFYNVCTHFSIYAFYPGISAKKEAPALLFQLKRRPHNGLPFPHLICWREHQALPDFNTLYLAPFPIIAFSSQRIRPYSHIILLSGFQSFQGNAALSGMFRPPHGKIFFQGILYLIAASSLYIFPFHENFALFLSLQNLDLHFPKHAIILLDRLLRLAIGI